MKPAAAPHNCYITFIVACVLILVATPGFANNYTVNTTADGRTIINNVIPLRAAILAADAAGGTSTITVPAGTYHLTLGEITFGNNAQNITITGAGAGSTIINMTSTNRDRIFLINPPGTVANVVTTITGISFTNGYLTSDVYGGGAIICGGPGNSTTITNCAFSGNQITKGSAQGGGAVGMQGGGSLFINQCTFSNNSSDAAIGGAIGVFLLAADNLTGSVSITNCNFSNNSVTSSVGAGTLGGALAITTQSPNAGQTFPATIQYNTFLNNNLSVTANGGGGGAIYIASSYNTNINYNRFSGNMLGTTQDALCVSQPYGGPTDATNNWWGSNDDPGITNSTPRQTAYIPAGSSGTGTLITTPRLLLTTSVSKGTICQGANTSVATASFLTNSLNTAVSTGNLTQLIGLPISFSVVNGTLSGAQTNIQSTGTATVTFTGNEAAGNCSVDPVVDNVPSTDATAKATVMVSAAPTIASGSQPASQLDCLGSTANFTVTATSIASVTYQWYKNTSVLSNGTTGTGSTVSGATSATLSIANPGASDATNYKVVATNICGSVTSNTVALSFYGSRLYVASGSNGDGGSWDSPLGDLTAALSTASSCSGITEIWVKSGTYTPSSVPYNAFSVLTQDKAFTLVSGVAVYGGFAGSETSLSKETSMPTQQYFRVVITASTWWFLLVTA